ncbi:MAG: hypothetical protein QOD90_6242 [Mycobacterium sp.]|jgi:hypothetical protein|nr:hypothetical protein [Mycobacterium sp.]
MTSFSEGQFPPAKPMPDVAEQERSAYPEDDATLDVDYVNGRSDEAVNPADLIEQAIDIPLPEADR